MKLLRKIFQAVKDAFLTSQLNEVIFRMGATAKNRAARREDDLWCREGVDSQDVRNGSPLPNGLDGRPGVF